MPVEKYLEGAFYAMVRPNRVIEGGLKPMQISCQAHDYVEVVCMRRSRVQLTLYDGGCVVGLAQDIARKNNTETIQLLTDSGVEWVELTAIKTLEALENSVEAHNFTVQLRAQDI